MMRGQRRTIRRVIGAGQRRQQGQTLVMAIIILAVLLILGFAFATIIGRNITEAGRAAQRTVAGDLSQDGVRYAHYQLLHSALGADWRPASTPPLDVDAAGYTKDPDALYLRQPDTAIQYPSATNIDDKGGPDGLGPYTRVFFDRGRALIRVRYAPSDYDAFSDPTGALRQPGRARNYIVIDSVGRPGTLLTGGKIDPSRLLSERVRVTNYTDIVDKAQNLGLLKAQDTRIIDSRKLMAFASIGIIEHGRYITDKHKIGRPADIGYLTADEAILPNANPFSAASPGIRYEGQQVSVITKLGDVAALTLPGRSSNWADVPGGGGIYSNTDLRFHGRHDIALNRSLGEAILSAGDISGANSQTSISVTETDYNSGTDQWQSNALALTAGDIDSRASTFSTQSGLIRDGSQRADTDGYSRGIARKEPPSIVLEDPQGGLQRYVQMTRASGPIVSGTAIGRWGYGRGTYVDSPERGNLSTEDQRQQQGAVRSLPNDWLNPNNANSLGWQGPYYIPLASYLKLLPDGFEIIRDSRSSQRYWRATDGTSTNESSCRFRLRTIGGQPWILNSIQHPALVNQPFNSLADSDFTTNGQQFNGVIYFEGDVRVRGVIPTDHQLSVVSMGSIYVEGSITKGLVLEDGTMLSAPSLSALMLMARDYVVYNTTTIFAPAPGESPNPKNADNLPDTPNPVEMDLGESPDLTLMAQFLLNPLTGTANDPSSWLPFGNTYEDPDGVPLSANLLVSSSADDNGPTFVSIDVAPQAFAIALAAFESYLFPRTIIPETGQYTLASPLGSWTFNAADGAFPAGTNIPIYGLGDPPINAYPKFETFGFPFITSDFNYAGRVMADIGGPLGDYSVAVQDPTLLRLRLVSAGPTVPKNYLFARTAVAPFDVRIEAAVYAEEGSFYVIPGNWMNMNPADTREDFVAQGGGDAARRNRLETFGHTPDVPFYGEPLDVRIILFGAVSENMPAPISQQAEWLQKWGWIPRGLGATGRQIAAQHVPNGYDLTTDLYVPNLIIQYDPALATASADGQNPIRTDANGWVLPPMPRLPVSPTLAYFGEVNP